MGPKAAGSVYRVKNRHVDQIKLYSNLECITDFERKFILGLIGMASTLLTKIEDNDQSFFVDITRPELQDWLKEKKIGSGDTIIKKRSNALTDVGLFVKTKFQRPKCKPADHFILQDATDVIDKPAVVSKFGDHRSQRKNLREIKTSLIDSDAQVLDSSLPVRLARSERLWNGVFGSAMRTSRTDPRRNEPFTTIYRFGKDQIKIITSAQTDGEICHVDDQRTIRAVITLACIETAERIDLGKEIENAFYIDIVDLCAIMGLDGSGANRDTVRDSMKRLYSTNFNLIIDSESEAGSNFAKQFGITPGADDLNFRFLTELDSSIDRAYGGGSIRRPRWYRIAFHSKTFQDLIDPTVISTFIDNKEILKLSSGLIHIFYTWCCIHVKRRGKRVMSITLPDLQKALIPASRYDNFRDRLLTAIKRHQNNSPEGWDDLRPNIIKLFGYVIKMEADAAYDYIFTIFRDKNDLIIGDGSIHNRLSHITESKKKDKFEAVSS